MADQPVPVTARDTKTFRGKWLLYRKKGGGLRHPTHKAKDRAHPPRFRHDSYAAAEAEAGRLLAIFPESTFVILQEVGRVKLKPVEPAQGAA